MVGICIQKQDGMVKKMTNEQAAEILEEVKVIDDGLGQYIPGFEEALDLAIAKLRAGYMTEEEMLNALGKEPIISPEDDYCYGKRDQYREDIATLQLATTSKGRWIFRKLEGEVINYNCSECGHSEVVPKGICSRCGAEMDWEE